MRRNIWKKKLQRKINIEEDKINDILDISIHSLSGSNDNKYQNNNGYEIKNNENDIMTKDYKNYKNKRNDIIQLKTNKIANILGKINQELCKNQNHYNSNISNISECFQKDYLNLRAINKAKENYSNNQSRNISKNNSNKKLLIYGRKINYYNYDINEHSRNSPNNNNLQLESNIPFNEKHLIPIYKIYQPYKLKYQKNKISNFILKNTEQKTYSNTHFQNDYESDTDHDNKIIQVSKVHKSLKKYKNKSQSRFKSKLNSNKKNNKNNGPLSNPKNLNNMGNFYNYWTDNDRHLGGKINLSLNNQFINNIDSYSYLYYIIKIQSIWRGYYSRKSLLLRKSFKNQKLNIFYKQKLLIKTLFNILNYKFKKYYFKIIKNKLNNKNNKYIKKGYDIKSHLLNKISNCYQNYYKSKNGNKLLLHNKKRLIEVNLKVCNNISSELVTPKIKRNKTILNNNFGNINNNNNKNNTEYQILKTHSLCYKSHKKNNVKKEKEDIIKNNKDIEKEKDKDKNNIKEIKKFLNIIPDEKNTNHFSIKNINLKNIKKYELNRRNNYQRILINNKNNKRLNKYKEYVYFLFLLFSKIQKASYRLIFTDLLKRLKKVELYNIKRIRASILLRIIKKNEKKKKKNYLKIFKEKILIEKIKEKILNINKNNLYRVSNKNNIISNSENKTKSSINRQGSKRHIKIKKIPRSTSVNQSLNNNTSYYLNNFNHISYSGLSKSLSSSISPKKMILKHRSKAIRPKNLGEYYEYTPGYLLKKKVDDIFKKLDKKEIKHYFKKWKMKKDAKKKKKFLIYFIMLMKEYFCNDKSLKYNKEYAMGKFMFFWYRKAFI